MLASFLASAYLVRYAYFQRFPGGRLSELKKRKPHAAELILDRIYSNEQLKQLSDGVDCLIEKAYHQVDM